MTSLKKVLIAVGFLTSLVAVNAQAPTPVAQGQPVQRSQTSTGRVLSATAIVAGNQNQPNPTGSLAVELTNSGQQVAKFDVSAVSLWTQDGSRWVQIGYPTHYQLNKQSVMLFQQATVDVNPGETIQLTIHYELRNRTNQKKANENTNVNLAGLRVNNLIFDFAANLKNTSRLS